MSNARFDDLTDVYEAMVDWPKRLSHEAPFFRRLFRRVSAKRVVDVACGTGHHAALWNSWGVEVEGADISPNMIRRAKQQSGESSTLRWEVRSFDEPILAEVPFDVALCLGNSLALAPDNDTVGRAIEQMLAAVRPGGAIVVHVLNLWRLPEGPCVWQKCRRATMPSGEVLIIKGVQRHGSRGYVNLLVTPLETPEHLQSESPIMLGLEATELERIAMDAGASETRFFGGYRDQPYDREASVDLIMLAEKK